MHNFVLDVKGADVVKAMDATKAHLEGKVPYIEQGAHTLHNGTEVVVRLQAAEEDSQRLQGILNEWFCEDFRNDPPFPVGSLLYWHIWDVPGNFPEGSNTDKLDYFDQKA